MFKQNVKKNINVYFLIVPSGIAIVFFFHHLLFRLIISGHWYRFFPIRLEKQTSDLLQKRGGWGG